MKIYVCVLGKNYVSFARNTKFVENIFFCADKYTRGTVPTAEGGLHLKYYSFFPDCTQKFLCNYNKNKTLR